jgi:hypothetical protein
MSKDRELVPGDGVTTGDTGLVVRNLINDFIPDVTYIVPVGFDWTALLDIYANKTLLITNSYTVTGAITLPAGCVLKFEGGKLLGTYTITGSGSRIINHDNKQIFSLNTTIAGTWVGTKACVEWWGAVSNPNITTYANDVMPFIAKLAVSGFEAFALGGFYYIGSTLKILQPFDYKLLDNIQPFGAEKLNDSGAWVDINNPTPSQQTTFYSNLNINWFEVESPYVNIVGGIFDISAVTTITHWCIYTSNNDTVDHCHFKQVCRGIPDNTKLEGQTGGYFRWEALSGVAHTVAGHLYKVTIETECLNIPYGINIDEPDSDAIYDWANGIDVINSRFTGCKVGLRHMSGSWANIQAIFQSGVCHAESERGLYQMYVRGYPVIADVFCWDLFGTEETVLGVGTGYYYPALPVYSESYGLQITGASLVANRLSQFRGVPPMGIGVVNEDTRVRFFRHGSYGTFISDVQNRLSNLNLETGKSITITAYEGAGYDFDDIANRLPATATPNPNITINYPQNLVRNNGFATTYVFGVGTTDYDLDFIEIVITGYIPYLQNIFLSLGGHEKAVNRIQVIPLDGSNNILPTPGVLNQYPVTPYYAVSQAYDFICDNASVSKVVIRLIGTTTKLVLGVPTPQLVGIYDLAAKVSKNNINFVDKHYSPMFTFHGFLNQSGTTDGVVTTFINNVINTADVLSSPTLTYHGVGIYRFNLNDAFSMTRTMPKETYNVYTPLGRVQITLYNTSRYDILTFDLSDAPANGILVNFPFIANTYW